MATRLYSKRIFSLFFTLNLLFFYIHSAQRSNTNEMNEEQKQSNTTNSVIDTSTLQQDIAQISEEDLEAHQKRLQSFKFLGEEIPGPELDIEPLDSQLAQRAIAHCPERVNLLIQRLKNDCTMQDKYLSNRYLFFGPPGTGKTSLCKAIAAECKLPFFLYSGASISNQWQNSGPININKIFRDAKMFGRPCIVIIDEIEELCKQFNNKYDVNSPTIVRLWQALDSIRSYPVLFIATANKVGKCPAPFKSRFRSSTIEIPLPNYQQRLELIHYYISRFVKTGIEKDLAFDFLAQKTEGCAHRDLEELISLAYEYNKNEFSLGNCLKAFNENKEADKHYNELPSKKIFKTILKWGLITIGGAGLGVTTYFQIKGKQAQQESAALQQKSLILQQQAHEASMALQQKNHQESLAAQKSMHADNMLMQGLGILVGIIIANSTGK